MRFVQAIQFHYLLAKLFQPKHKQMAVVIAHAVESQITVRAGRVRIPGRPQVFWSDCLYSRWALGFFYRTNHRTQTMSSLLSCFLSSSSINIVCPSINCNQCTKREINKKKCSSLVHCSLTSNSTITFSNGHIPIYQTTKNISKNRGRFYFIKLVRP